MDRGGQTLPPWHLVNPTLWKGWCVTSPQYIDFYEAIKIFRVKSNSLAALRLEDKWSSMLSLRVPGQPPFQ
jgi:hypothetical protein